MTALSEPGLYAYFLRHRVFFHYKRRAGDCQAKLLIPQRFDRVELGGFVGGVVAEEHPDRHAEVWKIHKTAPITPIKSIKSPFSARSTRSPFCKNIHISAYREPRPVKKGHRKGILRKEVSLLLSFELLVNLANMIVYHQT